MGLLKSIEMKSSSTNRKTVDIDGRTNNPVFAKKSILQFSSKANHTMLKKSMMPPAHVWDKIEKILDEQNANKKNGKGKLAPIQLSIVKGEKQHTW